MKIKDIEIAILKIQINGMCSGWLCSHCNWFEGYSSDHSDTLGHCNKLDETLYSCKRVCDKWAVNPNDRSLDLVEAFHKTRQVMELLKDIRIKEKKHDCKN